MEPTVAVIVPAHNEEAVLGRLLTALLDDARPGEFAVVVVANGCTDGTAALARTFGPDVTVVETPVAGKHHALRLGDRHAPVFPRAYTDADVVIDAPGLRLLAEALRGPGVLAVAPGRRFEMRSRPLVVRWYHRVWERLPSVRAGLYGRGVVMVGEEGHRRIAALPETMGDDLAASVAFAPQARRVVRRATVIVHPPRTTRDLIRRRVRSLTATTQLQRRDPDRVAEARTGGGDLTALARSHPALLPHLAVFLAVTAVARLRARGQIRRGDFRTWLRDESSRTT